MARRRGERVARDLLSVRVPDGSVLLHVPTGRYLRANQSAATIVGLLSEGNTLSEAARRFSASEGISLEAGEAGVGAVMESLRSLERASTRGLPPDRVRATARLVRQWSRLPRRFRWPVLEVVVLLGLVEIGLRTLDLRRLSALVGAPLSDAAELTDLPLGRASTLRPRERRALWAIEWIDGRWLVQLTCLRRALVTGFVLRKRHGVLRLGLTGNGQTAHAWIEADGAGYGLEEVGGVFAAPAPGDGATAEPAHIPTAATADGDASLEARGDANPAIRPLP